MYLADYHLHTYTSSDSKATLTQQARAAVAAGLSEICVTDHWNLLDQQGAHLPLVYDWETALKRWKGARSRCPGKLEIRFGVEVGNGIVSPEMVDAGLALPELDFAIGSLHSMSLAAGGKGIYTAARACRSREEAVAVLEDYITETEALVETKGFDVLGHIIYPLRYLPREYELTLEPWHDRVKGILKKLIQSGRGIEFNTTNGQTVQVWKPVLEQYKALGGEILTLGSDAHRPEVMAAAFPEALELIRDCGFRYLALYRYRQPIFTKID